MLFRVFNVCESLSSSYLKITLSLVNFIKLAQVSVKEC